MVVELWAVVVIIGAVAFGGGSACGLIVIYVQYTSREERARQAVQHGIERAELNKKIQELEDKVDRLSAKVESQNEIILRYMRSGGSDTKPNIHINAAGDTNVGGDVVGSNKTT